MKTRHLPPQRGWGVWIGHYERKNWKPEWISQPLLLLSEEGLEKRSSREATYFNSNTTTQVIGKLFIQVIHCPMRFGVERWRFATPNGGTLFRIWPVSQISIKWPGNPLNDGDADAVAAALPTLILRFARTKAPG